MENWIVGLLVATLTGLLSVISNLPVVVTLVLALLVFQAVVVIWAHQDWIEVHILGWEPWITFNPVVRRGVAYLEVKNNRDTDEFKAQLVGFSPNEREVKPTRPISLPWNDTPERTMQIEAQVAERVRLGELSVRRINATDKVIEQLGPDVRNATLTLEGMKDFLPSGLTSGTLFGDPAQVDTYRMHMVVLISGARSNRTRRVGVTITLFGAPEDDPLRESRQMVSVLPALVTEVHEETTLFERGD